MYEILIEERAIKCLKKLSTEIKQKIKKSITSLSTLPRTTGSVKLKGSGYYRIRVSNYRIIYEIEDDKLLVRVIFIGHRKDIYRNIK